MPGSATSGRLAEIAQDQWGLITRRQAAQAGISTATLDRLTASGVVLERVAHGVYRLTGAPMPDHVELRAAWLQLAPEVPAWNRTPADGIISHRSAATLYGLGHLPADRHQFTMPARRQSRRADVRLYQRKLTPAEYADLRGLPVTRPSRIASDLLFDREDPDAVAQVVADAIRGAHDHPATFVERLAVHAARFGLRHGDGLALLQWLLELVGDRDTSRWMTAAQEHRLRTGPDDRAQQTPAVGGAPNRP
jgi:hypothetical protein